MASESRYALASRLHELKAALAATGGLTIYEIAERFDVSVITSYSIHYTKLYERREARA